MAACGAMMGGWRAVWLFCLGCLPLPLIINSSFIYCNRPSPLYCSLCEHRKNKVKAYSMQYLLTVTNKQRDYANKYNKLLETVLGVLEINV